MDKLKHWVKDFYLKM